MNAANHPTVSRYLQELERALHDIPKARRREIVEEIREHIQEASESAPSEADDVQLRTVLDQVGDPETIAEEARERLGVTRAKAGVLEGIAIALLLVGGLILPAVGWVIGAVLLWISRTWTFRDKLIGTLVVPGGLALPAYLLIFAPVGVTACTILEQPDGGEIGTCASQPLTSEPWGLALMIVVTLLPIATAFYLGRKAFR